jgi:hypothetical protein
MVARSEYFTNTLFSYIKLLMLIILQYITAKNRIEIIFLFLKFSLPTLHDEAHFFIMLKTAE